MSESLGLAIGHFVDEISRNAERSVVQVSFRGETDWAMNKISTTTYRVSRGEGTFYTIDADGRIISHDVRADSEIVIPPNTPYREIGELMMTVTCEPPFNEADVVRGNDILL